MTWFKHKSSAALSHSFSITAIFLSVYSVLKEVLNKCGIIKQVTRQIVKLVNLQSIKLFSARSYDYCFPPFHFWTVLLLAFFFFNWTLLCFFSLQPSDPEGWSYIHLRHDELHLFQLRLRTLCQNFKPSQSKCPNMFTCNDGQCEKAALCCGSISTDIHYVRLM